MYMIYVNMEGGVIFSMSIGALGSPDLVLSPHMIELALHNTITLIITYPNLHLSDQPYPKSLSTHKSTHKSTQLLQVPRER